jgi:hypothetical protein
MEAHGQDADKNYRRRVQGVLLSLPQDHNAERHYHPFPVHAC